MTPVAPRAVVGGLPAYRPGRSAAQAVADHGLASAVKLASNELPYGPLPSVADAIQAATPDVNRYPDHRANALRQALAERSGVDAGRVTVGCGSVGLLFQLASAFCESGDEVVYGWRSFEAYPIVTRLAGATPVAVPVRRQALDLAAMAGATTERTRLVLVANPDNPHGTVASDEEVRALVEAVPETCLVVFDEAYREFVSRSDARSAVDVVGERANVVVLRTFSKAHGLAGLRVGYGIGAPEVVAAVDKLLWPFAVNHLGQRAALASLEAADALAARVEGVIRERGRVAAALRHLGFSVPDPQANFVWLAAGAAGAAGRLAAALEALGVVTRPFDGDGVRVTIGAPAENDRFLDSFEIAAARVGAAEGWQLPTGGSARRVAGWLDRLDAVESRLTGLSTRRRAGRTAPDPGGTERWDEGQVWAHIGELGAYWLGELRSVVDAGNDGATPFGRVKSDPGRVAAIETGRRSRPADHLAHARRAMDGLRALLAGLDDAEWGRRGVHPTLGAMTVDAMLEEFVIGHLEQHAAQLEGLAP